MPRVSYLRTKNNRTRDAMAQLGKMTPLIRGHCGDAAKLGRTVGVSQPTAQKWLKNPELLTLEQLVKIALAYDIPCEDVVSKIRW